MFKPTMKGDPSLRCSLSRSISLRISALSCPNSVYLVPDYSAVLTHYKMSLATHLYCTLDILSFLSCQLWFPLFSSATFLQFSGSAALPRSSAPCNMGITSTLRRERKIVRFLNIFKQAPWSMMIQINGRLGRFSTFGDRGLFGRFIGST